jgi:L-ascorbate metabolism protein UlaG (beta-lactamase superfamily)
MSRLLYLKSTAIAEPLTWGWYAWSYLIPPVTAACNISDRYIKIMQSYVQAPQIHAQAMRNPELLGGPFIDLNGENVDEVRKLIDETKENCKELLELANSVKEFSRFLESQEGDSLEKYYEKLPVNLKGLVEIVYDLNHNASIKLIEPLLYDKYYNPSFQSIALSNALGDHRPFIMSTPNLKKSNQVILNMPFSDDRLDILFSMRMNPLPENEVRKAFDIKDNDQDLFWSFFTEEKPKCDDTRNYKGDGIRIRYFGHSCLLIQTSSVSILIDPVISYKVPSEVKRFTFEDLPDTIDYVLLTHNHQDHVLFESLLQLRHKIKHVVCPDNNQGFIADPSLKLILEKIGFTSVISLRDFEKIQISDGKILGVPFLGEHSDLNIHSKIAYLITLKEKKILFVADSNNLEHELYVNTFKHIGPVDILYIGMECDGAPLTWLYGPLLVNSIKRTHDTSRTLSGSNFKKAWAVIQESRCTEAYVYAMGQEPWLNYIMALEYSPDSIQITESDLFVKTCHDSGIKSERLFGKREWVMK